jgi:hypothetical protein
VSAQAPPADAAGPLQVVLSCPQCGAPALIDEDAVSLVCEHCSSFLVVTRPGREPFFVADDLLGSGEAARLLVIAYRVQGHRAEVLERYAPADAEGRRPDLGEAFIAMQLQRFERRLLESVRLVDAHRLQVPYWHTTGDVLHAVLGREHEGPKQVRLRAFLLEHTAPGYAPAFNLRDRGLRLARACVRPLTRHEVGERGPFLPWVPLQERERREIRRFENQNLEPDFDPVVKRGGFVFERRCLVYRPYWLVRLIDERGQEWVLLDGSFQTVAGHPDSGEVMALLRAGVDDPEGREAKEIKGVVRPSRCPDCGNEQRFPSQALLCPCSDCHRALMPTEEGIVQVGCAHAFWDHEDLDALHLPFWVFEFKLGAAGSPPVSTLEAFAALEFPQGRPPGFAPTGSHLFVPAFGLLGTEPGDGVFRELIEAIHRHPPRIEDGRVPIGGDPELLPVTVSEESAREAAPFVLLGLHDKTAAARLNTMLVKRTQLEAKLALGKARLVMVAVERRGEDAALPGTAVVVPRLFLRGGPELSAMRATVLQPRPRVAT